MADHELRRGRIGGSRAAALFGAHEYLDEFGLYAEMLGSEPRPPNIRMIVGKAMERGILALVEWKTGKKVEYHDRTIVDAERPYMAATPDGFIAGEQCGVDAKLVWWDQRHLWGEDVNSIPQQYVIQAWWYCAAFGFPRWLIAALIGMDDLRLYTVERDLEVERVMLARAEQWHARYILGGEVPPLGRSEAAGRWLQAIYPNHKRPDIREADADEAALLDSYVDVRKKQRELKLCQSEMETALKAAIKDREGLRWDEGLFTWRKTKDGEKTDWESMAHWLMHKHVEEPDRPQIIADYTTPKPGFRKIRIDHPALKKSAGEEEAAA